MLFKSIREAIALGKDVNSLKSTTFTKLTNERAELQDKTKLMKAFLASSKLQ